ncbi:MAG: hypothetical protein HY843_01315 [Bdellovibrio sp.]|nr:hypothetical protein [Bdellovibrio sp.]
MKIIIDECLPKKLKNDFGINFIVKTVPEMGWNGISNGDLLNLIYKKFDVFITIDSNLVYQQNLDRFPNLKIIVLKAKTNRYYDLKKLVHKIIKILIRKFYYQVFVIK